MKVRVQTTVPTTRWFDELPDLIEFVESLSHEGVLLFDYDVCEGTCDDELLHTDSSACYNGSDERRASWGSIRTSQQS